MALQQALELKVRSVHSYVHWCFQACHADYNAVLIPKAMILRSDYVAWLTASFEHIHRVPCVFIPPAMLLWQDGRV